MVKWNYNKIINEIKKNGYFVHNNFLSKKNLDEIKESLLDTLNYVKKSSHSNLTSKYYFIKKYNEKLKGNWYDIANYNLTIRKHVHSENILKLVRKYYNSKTVFSVRPCIHAHDSSNDFILKPHQETNMFSKDGILLWIPLFDTNENTGGLTIYEKSHLNGFYQHATSSNNSKKNKLWTKNYTNISDTIVNKFQKKDLSVKAGSGVFIVNSLIHCGYQMKKKNHLRVTLTERFNPLQNIPFLKNENAKLKIPYTIDYNKIKE